MKKLWMIGVTALMMLGSAVAQSSPGSQMPGSVAPNLECNKNSSKKDCVDQQERGNQQRQKQGKQQIPADRKQADSSDSPSKSSASDPASKKGGSGCLAAGCTLLAELTRPVDAKKAKVGDQVTARTAEDVKSGGKVVVRKGSKLIGHVTQVKSRAKGESESSLGIVFDRCLPKNGGPEVPVHAVIQAVAAGQAQATASMNEMETMTSGSGMAMGRAEAGRPARSGGAASGGLVGGGATGGLVGGAGSTLGSTAGIGSSAVGTAGGAVGSTVNTGVGAAGSTVDSTVNAGVGAAGSAAGLNAAGELTSASSGVIGLQGLNLSSAASNSTQGSLLTCADRNVRLESGTQMVLKVASE